MGLIVDKTQGISTVGELVSALSKFPQDMALNVEMSSTVQVYRVSPQDGEIVEDVRGYIHISSDD